ncbi:N-acetyltransferase [Mucisphaera calidilacus]|uniref:Amino-acid acetyltransferase n=1 Tax=Mucisphaera calidilacus TaxID=2527982 RepID=A0A518BW42_9BACT|nr:N-acetyltransferase [Mucisphaera calidilacus]QDU71205.1 Amino-acid acetyltransferase [Mucisphaera calidilacus]
MSAEVDITIRNATVADVPSIARLINDSAELGLMLPRPMATLYERVRELFVADRGGAVVGVGGLSIIWADLAEVVSLVVDAGCRGHGLGGRLVEACVGEARRLGVRRLMTLTYEQAFFERHGFVVVDRQALPLKVWSECLRCPKNQACDEIAMIRVLDDVAELTAPRADVAAPRPTLIPILAEGHPVVGDGIRRSSYPPVDGD